MKTLARRAALSAAIGLLVLWLAWGALTIYFSNLPSPGLRQALSAGYVAWLALAALALRPRKRGLTALLVSGLLVSAIYVLTSPSNERDWQPDVAVASTATIEGETLTIDGVRDFRYRSESDFDQNWERRSYDLSKLRTLDLFMSYWGPTDYCHTILSFGFEGGEHLAASIEVRKEVGESFSTYAGFFKRFELCYVFADERDVIALRTNHRGEDVLLYRLRADPQRLRELLLSYVRFADELAREPRFYDVLASSCGVSILERIAETEQVGWSWTQGLFNGRWDRLLYERGALHQGLSFDELRARSHINAVAQASGHAADFSERIRAALPEAPAPAR